jgi:hypothetical protein
MNSSGNTWKNQQKQWTPTIWWTIVVVLEKINKGNEHQQCNEQ